MMRQLPNLLSGLRLLLAPVAAWLILYRHDGAALAVFAIAALSDGLDGFIARRFSLQSAFGALLDPVADKLLMLFVFSALFAAGAAPWWVAAVVVSRDMALAAGWVIVRQAALPITFRTLAIGKLSTIIQLIYVLALLVMLAFHLGVGGLAQALAYLTALVTLAAALAYAREFVRQLSKKPA